MNLSDLSDEKFKECVAPGLRILAAWEARWPRIREAWEARKLSDLVRKLGRMVGLEFERPGTWEARMLRDLCARVESL